MLGDAFAAIVIRAIRATADCFAVRMMKTTLLGKCRNGEFLTPKRLEAAAANSADSEPSWQGRPPRA